MNGVLDLEEIVYWRSDGFVEYVYAANSLPIWKYDIRKSPQSFNCLPGSQCLFPNPVAGDCISPYLPRKQRRSMVPSVIKNPTKVMELGSITHKVGQWSNKKEIILRWKDATDEHSGLYGYFVKWDDKEDTIPTFTDRLIKAKIKGALPQWKRKTLSEGKHYFHIENVKEALASTQLITITDPLSDKLDWSTFELGDMHFGHHHIEVPEGLTYYFTRVDLRAEGNYLFVDIEASFDPVTGIAKWTFTAIDPDTGELTEDVLAGFLPLNVENHEGEGYVKFKIKPKHGLESGEKIDNVATIVFDWNEPMDTPLVLNTIDSLPPSSHVLSLPVTSRTPFEVKWTGLDDENGSGISPYDIYVSENGGDYNLWLDNTTANGGIFAGEVGNTYGFYSVAIDNVGNREMAPGVPDATTTVTTKVMTKRLKKGFNLISAPTDTENIPDAYTFLRFIDNNGTKVEKIARYNQTSGVVQETFYEQDGSIGGDNFSIVAGEALIIYVKEDMTIELSQNNCPEFNLKTGANRVGTPCQPIHPSAFALLQARGDETVVSSIQRFNTDTGKFETAGYINGEIVGVDFPIKAGEGYFIYMKKDLLGFKP